MGIQTAWDNPERSIIIKTFTAPWTWHDFRSAWMTSRQMMLDVEHPVGVIFDMRQAGQTPSNPLANVRKAAASGLPPNWQLTVIVSGDTFVNSIVDILRRSLVRFEGRVVTAPSVTAAREIIQDHIAPVS